MLSLVHNRSGYALKPMDKTTLLSLGLPNYNENPKSVLTKGIIAQLLNAFLDPFSIAIDHYSQPMAPD